MNITGGLDLGLFEVNAAAELVQKSADPDANIIFGAVIDENLKDEILITVIATGFEKGPILKKTEKVVEKAAATPNNVEKPSNNAAAQTDELDIPTFLRRNRFK